MTMKSTDRAATKAEKLISAARTEYSGIQETINGYRLKAQAAAEAMEQAGDACDLDAYNKARSDKQAAEGAIEMFSKRADKLEREPLITREEYEKMTGEIIDEFDTYIEGLKSELYDITAALIAKHEEAHEHLRAANQALHTLQFDLYRGYDLEYVGDNVVNQSKKTVGTRAQFDIMNWANSISKTLYEQMRRERGEQ